MSELKVLLIDDDSIVRDTLKSLLEQLDEEISIAEAETVIAAQSLEATAFDAVFLDHNPTEDSGLASLEDVREHWPNAGLFFMTSLENVHIAKAAIQMGASDCLVKSELSEANFKDIFSAGVGAARRRNRANEQREEMATFVEVLVHDFRAPIRATAYLSEQIAEDLEHGETAEVRVGLKLLRESATQMMEMLKSLSEHVRFDRDAAVEAVEVDSLLRRAIEPFQVEIENASARVTTSVEHTMPKLSCYPLQIVQVLQNLIGNALKYCGERPPRIVISAKNDASDTIAFSVLDSGPGIPEKYAKRIFEPFTRLPGTGRISGTGLGLATCKKVVLRHGGRISCNSQVGKGTEITFSLPIDPTKSQLAVLSRNPLVLPSDSLTG